MEKKKRREDKEVAMGRNTFLVLLFEQHLELVIVERVAQGVEDRPHFFLLDPARLGRIEHGEGSSQHCEKKKNKESNFNTFPFSIRVRYAIRLRNSHLGVGDG